MRCIKLYFFTVDGGAAPKTQLKNIIQDGCTKEGYSYVEYPVGGSGDISLCYKITKD